MCTDRWQMEGGHLSVRTLSWAQVRFADGMAKELKLCTK